MRLGAGGTSSFGASEGASTLGADSGAQGDPVVPDRLRGMEPRVADAVNESPRRLLVGPTALDPSIDWWSSSEFGRSPRRGSLRDANRVQRLARFAPPLATFVLGAVITFVRQQRF